MADIWTVERLIDAEGKYSSKTIVYSPVVRGHIFIFMKLSAQEKCYARRAKFGLFGGSRNIYKAIAKLPKPESVFTLPGHKYTGPYNPLDKQLKHDKDTGKILEIYDKPTGKTDAIAMQHDLDYSMCKHNKKCKNEPDRKMVKVLDAVPYNERQWGQFLARNMINTKQKLGIGGSKKEKSCRMKTGRKN